MCQALFVVSSCYGPILSYEVRWHYHEWILVQSKWGDPILERNKNLPKVQQGI